jgi:hypothetical protein
MINMPEIIVQFCREMHVPMVEAVFGNAGVDAVFQVMETARSLYKHVELERVDGRVIIYRTVQPQDAAPVPPPAGPAADFAALANLPVTDLILEVASDGRPYSRTIPDVTLESLAENAVVYHWRAGQEEFLAGGERKAVPRLDSAARSQFAVPTFSSLREALQHYATENVRESTCYIFQQVWSCKNRLFLKAKPEATMRKSLHQFLRNRMSGDHDVWPEQVVDESHPVDIRVQPRFSNNRLMLIEIKWLGRSVAADAHITARHGISRAQEGANQLANYLDAQRQSAPSRVIQGYYVIIDGRRENLSPGATTICRNDGMYYEDKELTFDPSHHETRKDFDPPYRMFARPICAD